MCTTPVTQSVMKSIVVVTSQEAAELVDGANGSEPALEEMSKSSERQSPIKEAKGSFTLSPISSRLPSAAPAIYPAVDTEPEAPEAQAVKSGALASTRGVSKEMYRLTKKKCEKCAASSKTNHTL